MISGNIEKFNSPIRNITAKVELSCGGSTNATTSGNPITITDAVDYAAPVDIQLESSNLLPISGGTVSGSGAKLDFFSNDSGNIVINGTKYGANYTKLTTFATPITLTAGTYTLTGRWISGTTSKDSIYVCLKCNGEYKFTCQLNGTSYVESAKTITFDTDVEATDLYIAIWGDNSVYEDFTFNVKLEKGNVATPWTPYVAFFDAAEVIRTGKNLFPIGNFTYKSSTQIDLECVIPAGVPITISSTATRDDNPTSGYILINAMYVDGGTASGGYSYGHYFDVDKCSKTFTFPKPVNAFYFYGAENWNAGRERTVSITSFQVEFGKTATDYEPYRGVQKAVANSEGIVEGITSLAPTTTLLASNDVYMTATYEQAISGNSYTINHDDDLVSIEADRIGEGKFFGYGIGQKIDVKIRDKNRIYDIGTQHSLKAYFDDVNVLPTFYVKETKRDENTNGLTITAYDALEKASTHYTSELVIESETPTIREYAEACAAVLELGIQAQYEEFDFVGQANIEGSETIRDFLNDIAEATQTIYFINQDNTLTFKRLDIGGSPVYTIDKSKYFTLKSEPAKTLTAIVAATELGDNIEATSGNGEKQYVKDNAFWTLTLPPVEDALAAVNGTTITPFDCSWRGCYLVELGDKIALTAKDGSTVETYLLNDKIKYSGGLKQTSQWKYSGGEETATNPSTLGEALKQTFAKVDKQNKQIDIVVSEQKNSKSQISSISANLDSLSGTVSSTTARVDEMNGSIETLTKRVDATITEEELVISVRSELENGVDKVKTKEKNFTFDDEGLSVSSSENNLSTTITEDGMRIYNDRKEVLSANNEGVQAIDLHATTYLIIGKNSRFEDFGSNRTACFWIGG